MEKICGIYYIKNKSTGKLYIGQSIDIYKEWRSAHKPALKYKRHHNIYLQRAWNKYGEEDFEHQLIEECLPEQLNEMEKYYIKTLKSHFTCFGYNMSLGGESVMGGRKHTKETKDKMSKSKLSMSSDTKEKIGKAQIGRKIKTASSKYHGVGKRVVNKSKNVYWRASLRINKKYINIGNFKREEEAAIAYNNYVLENNLPHPLNTINKNIGGSTND